MAESVLVRVLRVRRIPASASMTPALSSGGSASRSESKAATISSLEKVLTRFSTAEGIYSETLPSETSTQSAGSI